MIDHEEQKIIDEHREGFCNWLAMKQGNDQAGMTLLRDAIAIWRRDSSDQEIIGRLLDRAADIERRSQDERRARLE